MLATSCQQGHLDVVRLLVHSYSANVRDCAIHSDDFAVINGLPLYAAAQAGNQKLTAFCVIINYIHCHCTNETVTLVNLLEFHVFF